MKAHTRLLSALLAASMLYSAAPPIFAHAAEPTQKAADSAAATGSISATLRLDYDQAREVLETHNVTAQLSQNGKPRVSMSLAEAKTETFGGNCTSTVTFRNAEGGEIDFSSTPLAKLAYIDVVIDGLPAEKGYKLEFVGEGYKPFSIDHIDLGSYSQHYVFGTGDATFTLGDLNGDGKIDGSDVEAITKALGKKSNADIQKYDLNGDGDIDIIDLAYVNHSTEAYGDKEEYPTSATNLQIDADAFDASIVSAGDVQQMLNGNGSVSFQPKAGADTIDIEIPLVNEIESEEIRIATPVGADEIKNGKVIIETEDGVKIERTIQNGLPVGMYAIPRDGTNNVIVINLGKRVPVKKITISVTRTESGFATVESIQFLKDIVPENPQPKNTKVKGLTALPGHEEVTLKWGELPNVTGYKVEYWEKDKPSETKQLSTDQTRFTVSGLKNDTTYTFKVTPVNDAWTGDPTEIDATPKASKAPNRVDMVNVTEDDGLLKLSWKKAENAIYYKVFYTDQENAAVSAYQQAGEQLSVTNTTITGLENGNSYYLYVIAGNQVGESAPSNIVTGTPKAVNYDMPEGIPVNALLSNEKIASIKLGDPNNVSTAYNGTFKPEHLIDKDCKTHWTARNWSGNEHVICTFTEPVSLSAAIWVPRLDGTYKNDLRAYSVQIWFEGEDLTKKGHLLVPNPLAGGVDNNGGSGGSDVWTWPAVRNNPGTTGFAVLPFTPTEGIKQISVAVEQRNYLLVSLSELMFVEYDKETDLQGKIDSLFADKLHTELAEGVTAEQITALRTELNANKDNAYYLNPGLMEDEINLADELLASGSTGVILNGVESRKTTKDKEYGQGGSLLQPLGVTAKHGDKVTIYAEGIPNGETLTVYATQFYAEASAWRASVGTISNGTNELVVPKIGSGATERGGSLYFEYSGESPESINLHIRRATAIPMLNVTDWYIMTDDQRTTAIGNYIDALEAYVSNNANTTNTRNVTEISTPSVLLSITASSVSTALNNGGRDTKIAALKNSILAWEDIMHICKTTQGIDATYAQNDMGTRQNIRCMQMFAGAFMYAAGNHIGIGPGSCGGMVGGKPISVTEAGNANNLFGWGIAHEIGHNMDKLGKAEITNNIYAILVQTYDGGINILESRLEKSKKYEKIFKKVAQQQPGASNDVFVQLGMYWQLHLAYEDQPTADAQGHILPSKFFNDFFKAWKKGTYFNGAANYDDRVALTAAGVTGKNLTEFFTRWGMTLSQSTKDKLAGYPVENRAIWYLNDQSRRERLKGTAQTSCTITATASVAPQSKTVSLTIAPSSSNNIQGYEIIRNGKAIDFITDISEPYKDVIGAGNNRTYKYKVVAYDILGNEAGSAEASEIRISYDQTVDASQYKIEQAEDGTVTVTFTEETAVSGLKILDAPSEGTYTVTATVALTEGKDDNKKVVTKEVTAREGNFNAGNLTSSPNYLTYFNKPGTSGTDDTRIWTYDATVLKITGIPSDFDMNKIQIISYAGDNIEFLEGGAVGRLSADYRYGDGADDVIKAGTLIIVGNYRGDPVYNTVKIQGKFMQTSIDEAGNDVTTEIERNVDGYALLFAEIPEDQEVSDISDGLFIFVMNTQAEKELQNPGSTDDGTQKTDCSGENLLPSSIRAVLSRTNMPDSTDAERVTAETLWIESPGGDTLPTIVLQSDLPTTPNTPATPESPDHTGGSDTPDNSDTPPMEDETP